MLRETRLIRSSPIRSSRYGPRLREPVSGLGTVPDDGEAAGRAAEQQHLPLCVGQLLRLVHDDVGERAGEQVRVGAGQCGLIDQHLLQVLVPQLRHQAFAVGIDIGRDQVVYDAGHALAFGVHSCVIETLAA